MKLSDGERLMLVMLSDVYQKLGIKGEVNPDFIKSAITSDADWGLAWEYPAIFPEPQENPEEVNETADILNMWRKIDNSYAALSDQEKKRVAVEADPFPVEFEGFDANNNPHYYIARFMIEELGRFEERKPLLNSHSIASLPGYRRMLKTYREVNREEAAFRSLTAEELIEILTARRAA